MLSCQPIEHGSRWELQNRQSCISFRKHVPMKMLLMSSWRPVAGATRPAVRIVVNLLFTRCPAQVEDATNGFFGDAVVALVERGGNVRALPVEKVDAITLRKIINDTVETGSRIMTDENSVYPSATAGYSHESINHSQKEWVRGDVTTNTAEGFFSLVKRGLYGTFHAVSRKHLHRYISEFQFRYCARKIDDSDRMELAIKNAVGKRLMYQEAKAS